MSKPITIPIKSHTKVRRPMSKYFIKIFSNGSTGIATFGVSPITDISKGLENPLHTEITWNKQVSEDIMFMDVPEDVREEINKDPDGYQPKPSLLTKLKNRFKK